MADNPKPYGNVAYADPKNGKYPIDTAAHAKSAWSYINKPDNAAKYPLNGVTLASVKSRIKAACEKFGIEISEANSADPDGEQAEQWLAGVLERFTPAHVPAGSSAGGQFAASSGSGAGKGKDTRPTPGNQNPVGKGETGKRVSDLQSRLNTLGFKPALKVDGIFGPKTRAAVVAFQKAHGLKPDGLVGPKTTAALRAPKAGHGKPAPKTAPAKAHPAAKTTPAKPAPHAKPGPPRGTEPDGQYRASDLNHGPGSKLWTYWTKGAGAAKWTGAVHKWTTLRDLLLKAGVPPAMADGLATNIITAVMPGYMKQAHKKGRSVTHAPDLDVVRSGGGMELQPADDGTLGTLTGRFSEFGRWYRVSSKMEGDFRERVAPGATVDTIRDDRDSMRVLFDHGMDAQIGNKVLGPIDTLEEKSDGPHYEVPLFDTSYNRDLLPGLKAGVYGASMRMRVTGDEWDDHPARSDANPDGIPERTITAMKVLEFGPVTFPANPGATSGVRSGTDEFYYRLRKADAPAFEDAVRAAGLPLTDFTGWDGARSAPGGDRKDARQENGGTSPTPPAVLRGRAWRMRRQPHG